MSLINNYFNPAQSLYGYNGFNSFGTNPLMAGLLGGGGGNMGGLMGMMYGGQGQMQMGMLLGLLMAALAQQQHQQQGGPCQGGQPQGQQQPNFWPGNQGYNSSPQGANGYDGVNFNSPVRNGNNWGNNGSYVSPQMGGGYMNPFQGGGCGCGGNSGNNGSNGTLTQNGQGQPITYTTPGGYKVQVNGTTVNITDPSGKNTVEESGDPHETLNGQGTMQANRGSDSNVNDEWTTQDHTIILGDGTRITMNAQNSSNPNDYNVPIQSTSIYSGNRDIQINNNGNQITSDTSNPYQTANQEMNQSMGVTETFGRDNNGGYTLAQLGTQSSTGGFQRNYQDLGNVGDTGVGQNNWGGGQNWGGGWNNNGGQNWGGGGENFWQRLWHDLFH